ncbi:ComEC/Rec2 family competence protein [Pseudomonas fluorescens]|uniref:Metallo-beta-lactamase domain-containing protein n=1 Tax=Pseudomonas fluorescens TaxID=294 RepID=A0A5E6QAA8_PSEFL|nr:hypothetical protein [Pseudomonas fluorescens]VVM53226.1 hypothetical protein PS624_00895 [Pseudomonas fluorescens]
MFRVRAIQVKHGDSLLVSYGDNEQPYHLLVDGGPSGSSHTLKEVLESVRGVGERLKLEVLVVTHYDLDHIQGIIELLKDTPDWLDIQEVWFNGYHHLKPPDILGSNEGDILSQLIRARGLSWNRSFRNDNNDAGGRILQSKHVITLPGGMEVRILSPDEGGLAALAKDWLNPALPPPASESAPGDLMGPKESWPPKPYAQYGGNAFVSDRSAPNRSSIALLLTFDKKRVLLGADAYSDVVKNGFMMQFDTSEPVDLLKVSHHGSKGNTNKGLLDMLECKRLLISTSGESHKNTDHWWFARLVGRNNSTAIYLSDPYGLPGNWQNRPSGWPKFTCRYPEETMKFVDVLL